MLIMVNEQVAGDRCAADSCKSHSSAQRAGAVCQLFIRECAA